MGADASTLTVVPEAVPSVDVRLLSISAREFFVYTLVDGQADVRQLVVRSGLRVEELWRSLRILAGAGAVHLPGLVLGDVPEALLARSASVAAPEDAVHASHESLALLLARVHREQRSGTVVVERGRASTRIAFVEGNVVDVAAAFTGEFFGTYLLERGKLTMAELQTSLQRMYAERRRQGEVLIEMAVVSEAELPALLVGHAGERVVECVGWEGADHRFLEGETLVARPIAVATSQVLFRAIRERCPMSVVQAELDARRASSLTSRVAAGDLDAARLGETERRVWERLHAGQATVADVLGQARLAPERAGRFLLAVVALGYVECSAPASASEPVPAASIDPEAAAREARARAVRVAPRAPAGEAARPGAAASNAAEPAAVLPDAGDLASTPAVLVLRAFLRSPRSGRLVFERGRVQKIVDLGGRGAIGGVLSVNADPPFGNFLLERGAISFQAYERTLQQVYTQKRRHGEVLVEAGALSREDLDRYLKEHLEHRLVDLFAWTDGRYTFSEASVVVRERHVDAERLLFVGARDSLGAGWIATEIARVHGRLAIPARGRDVAALGLSDAERAAWQALRAGTHTVDWLLEEAGEAANERARFLVALAFAGVIEFRGGAAEPRAQAPPSAEKARPTVATSAPAAAPTGAGEPTTDEVLLRRDARAHMRGIHTQPVARSTGFGAVRRQRAPRLRGFGDTPEFEEKLSGGGWEGDLDVEFVRENLSKTLKWLSHQHRFKILDAHESLTTEELAERYERRRAAFDPDGRRYHGMPEDIRNLARELCQVIDEAWQFLRDEPRRIEYRRNLFGESNLALEADVQFKKGDVLLFWKREPENAIPLYVSAIDLYPKNPDYHAALGLAVYRSNRKRLAEALSHLERGIRLRGESELPYMYLGMIYRDEGSRQKAADAFKKALQVNPRSKDARALLERLLRGATGDPSDDEQAG